MTIIQDNVKKMHDIRKHDGLNGHISSSSHNETEEDIICTVMEILQLKMI